MIKIRKAGVWSNITVYRRRLSGVWVDVNLGKRITLPSTWTIYYERILLTRPPEGNYSNMGVIEFENNGDVEIGPRYHDAVNTYIGRWRLAGVTPGGSDTIDVMVEHYLGQGDLEPGFYSSLGTWIALVPGSGSCYYSANNGGAGKAVLKITLKDQAARTLVFYAEIVYGGTGKISYSPIEWSSGGGGGGGGGGDPGGGGGGGGDLPV